MKVKTPLKKTRAILQIVDEIATKARGQYGSFRSEFYGIEATFRKGLKKAGFKYLEMGGYKRVYRHPKYPEFVVKVYLSSYGHLEDTNINKLPKWLRKYFFEVITKNQLYIIQPYANGKSKGTTSAEEALQDKMKTDDQRDSIYGFDITADNVQFHNGEPVIVDFCC